MSETAFGRDGSGSRLSVIDPQPTHSSPDSSHWVESSLRVDSALSSPNCIPILRNIDSAARPHFALSCSVSQAIVPKKNSPWQHSVELVIWLDHPNVVAPLEFLDTTREAQFADLC